MVETETHLSYSYITSSQLSTFLFQMYVNLKEYNSKLYANLEDLHGGD